MPDEQSGLVKENYVWSVLLHRGVTPEGVFLHVPAGSYDHDLFTMTWGPTIAALSYVFDKSLDDTIIQKAITGFRYSRLQAQQASGTAGFRYSSLQVQQASGTAGFRYKIGRAHV